MSVCSCAAGHGEMVQRILDILRFLWAIVLAMVDGLVQWLNLLTKQYRETSTVLCNERYFIIHKIQQVNTAQTFGGGIEHTRQTQTHTRKLASVSVFDWQHHTTADSTDDQLSMDSDSPTLESCLDETDAENFTGYRSVWTRLCLSLVSSAYQPHVDDGHHPLRISLRKIHLCPPLNHSFSFLEVDSSRVSGRCTPRPRRHSTGNLLSPEPPSSSSMELLPESSKQQHRYSRTASELLGDR